MFPRIYRVENMDLFPQDTNEHKDWPMVAIGSLICIVLASMFFLNVFDIFSRRELPAVDDLETVKYQLSMARDEISQLRLTLYRQSSPLPKQPHIAQMTAYSDEHAELQAEVDPDERVGYEGEPDGQPNVFASSVPRSPKWRTVRDRYAAEHPKCEFKNCRECNELFVHHKEPFHLNPARELDPSNLVTVCAKHHLYVCHDGNFRDEVPAQELERLLTVGEWPSRGRELYLLREAKEAKKKGTASKTQLAF